MIDTPAQGNLNPGAAYWCADNGCFGKGFPGNEGYLDWLRSVDKDRPRCAFATAPDVVGDAPATLARSAPMLPRIRALGYPAALVAQNGLEDLTVPRDAFDVLFLGGDTAWKLSEAAADLTAEARRCGKPVHMGRVNSWLRLRYATLIGCTSADGTYLVFGPKVNLPKVLRWLPRVTRLEQWMSYASRASIEQAIVVARRDAIGAETSAEADGQMGFFEMAGVAS